MVAQIPLGASPITSLNFLKLNDIYLNIYYCLHFRKSQGDVELGEYKQSKVPKQSKLSYAVKHVKPGPKVKSRGKLALDWTTNLILPAMDEVTDIVSGVNHFT